MAGPDCLRTALWGKGQFCQGFAAAAFLFVMVYMLANHCVVLEKRSPQNPPKKPLQMVPGHIVDEKKLFSFMPAGLKNCESLFKSGLDANLNFSSDYFDNRKALDKILNGLLKKQPIPEGHVGGLKEQSLTYFLLAKSGFVKTICETGFNAGHSALVYLAANPNVHIYSFDLGVHEYSKPMAEYLQKTFPGRLHVTWGNSINTVPAFVKANPDVKCDIISVDGGHDYTPCKADLRNLRGLARKKYHLLYIDDIPVKDKYMLGVKKAWDEELEEEHVQEHFKCQFYSQPKRGFTVGKYINL